MGCHGALKLAGCGKTFLMDLFYQSCTHIRRKRRVHFHAFMLDVHKRARRFSIARDMRIQRRMSGA
jgi:predicted ATPase